MARGTWVEGPNSWRTTPRPRGWKKIRARIFKRDGYQCTWIENGVRCPAAGTDCDHIDDPEDHSDANLRTLCGPHHRRRTGVQANQARWVQRKPRERPAERHPGLIA